MKQLVIGFILGLIGSIIGAFVSHGFTIRRDRRDKFNDAAIMFRGKFLNEYRLLNRWPKPDGSNTACHILGIETMNKHETAMMRFKQHLSWREKIGFDKAWKNYAGYDNESSDPQPGEYFLTEKTYDEMEMRKRAVHNIETLLTFASIK